MRLHLYLLYLFASACLNIVPALAENDLTSVSKTKMSGSGDDKVSFKFDYHGDKAGPRAQIQFTVPAEMLQYEHFLRYVELHPNDPIPELLKTFTTENKKLRIISRTPAEDALADLVTLFDHPDDLQALQTRIQHTKNGPEPSKDRHLMLQPAAQRDSSEYFSIVPSLGEFQSNFHALTDGMLRGLNWSNIVVAGSAVTASLFSVTSEHAASAVAHRDYYQRSITPTPFVELFLYGLEDAEAIEKLLHVEECIKQSVDSEIMSVRTARAITIISQGPHRDVTIYLRMHSTIPGIIDSRNIDSAAMAYDGAHILASPRALTAIMAMSNQLDLSKASPTYEDELAQAALLGFSIYWQKLNRDLVDPAIYKGDVENSTGLAKLLMLEKSLEKTGALVPPHRPIWPESGPIVSDGIGKMHIRGHLYRTDLRRNVLFHRVAPRNLAPPHHHPAFWGSMEDVVQDQCGLCPKKAAKSKSRKQQDDDLDNNQVTMSNVTYEWVSGPVTFQRNNVKKVHPLRSRNKQPEASKQVTEREWTATAYEEPSAMMNSAILDGDILLIGELLSAHPERLESRDCTGRTPLYFAVLVSATEVAKHLVRSGANPFALHDNDMTPLHLAAKLGQYQVIRSILIESTVDEQDILDRKPDGQMPLGMSEPVGQAPNLGIHSTLKDPAANALHLAVIYGHAETARVLAGEFGADPNTLMEIPPKQGGSLVTYSEPSNILAMSIAMRLPKVQAVEMLHLLLEIGASPLVIDKSELSVLHHAAAQKYDLLVAMTKNLALLEEVVDEVTLYGRRWEVKTTSLIQAAVESGDLQSVRFLLDKGASPDVTFEAFKKAYRRGHPLIEDSHSLQRPKTDDELPELFRLSVVPLVFVALNANNVQLAQALVEAGAYVNALTPGTHDYIKHGNARNIMFVGSVLDAVNSRLELLRRCKEEICSPQTPPYVYDTHKAYFDGLTALSYGYFSIKNQLRSQRAWDAQQPTSKLPEGEMGSAERSAHFDMLITQFEDLRTAMLAAGAKSLRELHPEVEELPAQPAPVDPVTWQPAKYMSVPSQSQARQDQYRALFEAIWSGDLATVKALLLKTDQPLNAAVVDSIGLSPFTVAMLRGHYETAAVVLDAALAQYTPSNTRKRSYSSQCDDPRGHFDEQEEPDNVDPSGTDTSSVPVRSQSGPVRLLRLSIRKSFSPSSLSPYSVHGIPDDDGGNRENQKPSWSEFSQKKLPETLLELAIYADDIDLLKHILRLGEQYTHRMAELEGEPRHSYTITSTEFLLAIRLGRTEMLAELIRSNGAGLPWGALTHELGLSNREWKEFYRVPGPDGEYSMDWLSQTSHDCHSMFDANGALIVRPADPPLLNAIRVGSLETIKWFLSEEAAQCYQDFVNDFPEDRRLAKLAANSRNVHATVRKWLSLYSYTVLHQISFRGENAETMEILEYLLSHFPSAINGRYIHGKHSGQTPLHFALSQGKPQIFTRILRAGGDPSILSSNGESILHALLGSLYPNSMSSNTTILHSVLSQLDPQLIQNLSTLSSNEEADSQTPLESWSTTSSPSIPALDTILSFTGPHAITPRMIHILGRRHHHSLLRSILPLRPDLLGYEDVNGKTPLENLQDEVLSEIMARPEPQPQDQRRVIDQGFISSELVRRPVSSFARKDKGESRDEAIWKTVEVGQEFGRGVRRRMITKRERELELRRLERKKWREEEYMSALLSR